MTAFQRRVSVLFPAALVLVVSAALVLTVTLGNPLGRAIGSDVFSAQIRHGGVEVASMRTSSRLDALAAWADDYRQRLCQTFAIPAASVSIRLLPNERAFKRYGQRHILGFSPEMDFCFSPADGCIYGFVDSYRRMQTRLQHEIVHSLLHQGAQGLPLWLEEGIAELAEGLEAHEDGGLVLGDLQHKRMHLVRELAANNRLASPAALARLRPQQFYGRGADAHYSCAYAIALLLYQQGRLPEALAKPEIAIDRTSYLAFVHDDEAWTQPQATPSGPLLATANHWTIQTRALGNR